jgi:hypothetical protein
MPMNPRLLRPRQAGGFDPRRISGLAGWWDLSASNTVGPNSDGSSLGTLTNNAAVSYVQDRSGNGRHMVNNGGAGTKPSYLIGSQNSLNVASFDGGDNLLASFASLTLTSQTVFMVLRVDGGLLNARYFSQNLSTLAPSEDFQITGHYIPLLRSSTGFGSFASGQNRATVAFGDATWGVAMSRHNGSQIQNRANNGSAATFSHTLNTSFDRFSLFATPSLAANLTGLLGECLVYTTAVADAERDAIARYLGAKWGITVL